SWDMTFEDKEASDYLVGQLWMRRGARAYLLDQVRGRWAFAQTAAR
ncbi:MAG: terminase, partial [Nocardioides sp.]|nr:terminase [Nocardioides sp.]